jgi:Phage portal protein, SPP1 Gp6-like
VRVLTAEQALAKVDALYGKLSGRRPEIEKSEHYFDGKQPLCYASDEWKKFHGERFAGFSDNWCGVVGAAAPELTEITGIRLGDDVEALSDDEKQLWRDWDVNDGPAQSAQGFQSGAVTKRSFALVWGDAEGEPVLTWEHSSQVIVDGALSLKAWLEDDRELVTLYEPDAVWKFERPRVAGSVLNGRTSSGLYVSGSSAALGGGWKPRQDTGDNTWPIPNPLGVNPMVEFPNRPMLGRGPVSDIDGTIAMQDAANLMWAYLFGAADFASLPGRVVMGQEPPKVPVLDANGQQVGEKPVDQELLTKGRMLWLTGNDTKIGQYEAAKLDVFTGVIDVMVKHIAAQTKTPINYMGALSNVNGETLDGLRDPLYMKVRDGHRHLTAPTRAVFRRLALVRDLPVVAEACRTAQILWRNPETATDAQTSDAALKDRQVGWSAAGILERRYGMSQPEIARELARRQAEAEDPLAQQLLRAVGGQDASGG